MIQPYRNCEQCKKPLPPTTKNNAARRKFCSDLCRYNHWKNNKEAQLLKLVKELAGRIKL